MTAGDPNEKISKKLYIHYLMLFDIIEIGIPFSDPMADGPTISSSQRAIKSKINLKKIFNMTKGFRKKK